MTWTYTPGATAKDNVRLMITDTDAVNPIFTDEEIAAFLALASDSTLIAAAMALEAIARSEALVQKVIRLLDLQTDGASLARELRMNAKVLRDQAEAESECFDVAEMASLDQFIFTEFQLKDALRNG